MNCRRRSVKTVTGMKPRVYTTAAQADLAQARLKSRFARADRGSRRLIMRPASRSSTIRRKEPIIWACASSISAKLASRCARRRSAFDTLGGLNDSECGI